MILKSIADVLDDYVSSGLALITRGIQKREDGFYHLDEEDLRRELRAMLLECHLKLTLVEKYEVIKSIDDIRRGM